MKAIPNIFNLRGTAVFPLRQPHVSWLDALYPADRTIVYLRKAADASKLSGKSQIGVIRPIVCQLFGVCFCACRLCRMQSALSTGRVGAQHGSCLHWGGHKGSTRTLSLASGCSPWGSSCPVELAHCGRYLLVPSFNNLVNVCE